MTYIPTRQRPARELEARGITIPYFHPSDRDHLPVTYHMTLVILAPEDLDRLVLICRKKAAKLRPNEHDNRDNLDYPVTNKERVNFLRHSGINRSLKNLDKINEYHGSYDSMMHRVIKAGVDIEHRQRLIKEAVYSLIAEHYPHLREECAYQLWLSTIGRIQ